MDIKKYDVIVIGAGPAGEGAAVNLAKHGKKVAVVDFYKGVGGNCTFKGTIPSKSLRYLTKLSRQFNHNPLFRLVSEPKVFSFKDILPQVSEVINKQVNMRAGFYARNGVDVIRGRAEFVDNKTIKVELPRAEEDQDDLSSSIYVADKFVIATGSRPYRPEELDFSSRRILDSDTILTTKLNLKHVVIYGAGVIGCEYASILSSLGVRVDLINTRESLLSYLDFEITDSLSHYFRENNIKILHSENLISVENQEDGVLVKLESGKVIKADAFVQCNGRSGNSEGLGLGNLGLSVDSRGCIAVDDQYKTAVEGVYAVGDIIGPPSLASASYDQGRIASDYMLGLETYEVKEMIPTGIYTLPAISCIGKTEKELTESRVPYETGRALFKNTARGQIMSEEAGMLKIIFHRETLEILGIHCFGTEAAEIIHIGQAVMSCPKSNSLEYFMNTTFNYPTMAESYRIAALNGINRLGNI